MQGNGAGLVTNSKSLDGINTTTTSASEQPKDLVTTQTEEPAYNDTLGTKLYLVAVCFIWIIYHIPFTNYLRSKVWIHDFIAEVTELQSFRVFFPQAYARLLCLLNVMNV